MTRVSFGLKSIAGQAIVGTMLMALTGSGFAQDGITAVQQVQTPPVATSASTAPVVITLDEAIRRAEKNEPNFANAVAAQKTAALNRSVARSGLLPNVVYHNAYLFTQSNGARSGLGQNGQVAGGPDSFVFIANNAIHEYASQASISETLGLAGVEQVRLASAQAAQAAAQAEVARRGLVFTVVQQYFGVLAAEQKLKVAQRAVTDAQNFAGLTQKLEQGREVAHADVLKAQLQFQQRQRDEQNAQLAAENTRLELGILLFPDPRTSYTLADGEQTPPSLPDRAAVDAAAQRKNPDLRAAMEGVRAANADVAAARAGYLPSLSLNWTYGIDAPEFATYGAADPALGGGKPKNLGYSATATLDIPVWDWFATHDRVKQSQVKRSVAKVALTQAQKRLLAELDEFYNEADVAGKQVTSLKQSAKDAAESLRLTNLRYQAGEATALEVVDAENTLLQAEQAEADGVVRYRVALANLQTLTGALP